MARGAASGYRGAVGETRTERLLYTCPCGTVKPVEVYRCVNAATHPDLAERLIGGSLNQVSCPDRDPARVNVSVIFHDPSRALFALVVPDCARHTELAERSDLLALLADECEYELPAYVRDFALLFGEEELSAHLEEREALSSREERLAEIEQELAKRKALLEKDEQAFSQQKQEFERVVAELERRNQELQEQIAELDRRADELARRTPAPKLRPPRDPSLPAVRDPDGTPLPRPVPHEEFETNPVELLSPDEIDDMRNRGLDPEAAAKRRAVIDAVIEEEQTGSVVAPDQIVAEEDSQPEIRGLSDQDATTVGGTSDVAIERWIVSREPELKFADEQGVRLAATATVDELDGLLGDEVVIRVQLHRLQTFPLVVIAIGAPSSVREPFCFLFDITNDSDRAVLGALAREFDFQLYLYDREYMPVQRRHVAANLSENVRFVLAAADEHLRSIPVEDRSFNKASMTWSARNFDRHGRRRPERALYRRELFDILETPGQVRRALEMVANFSRPELEELLVFVLGEPLRRWNQQRGKVVLKAVEFGLWPGPELAQIAVSAGAARSRKDLIHRLDAAFKRTVAEGALGLDAQAIAANRAALAKEAEAVGIVLDRSREVAVVSGTIGGDSGQVAGEIGSNGRGNGETDETSALAGLSIDELIARLSDKEARRDAAVELCRRGDARALGPVFETVHKMTRAEAVKVLGNVVKFGDVATRPLLDGLRSGKAFLRHGCALALGVLKNESGIEAICDQLLHEPTEIWRELARSVGEVGSPAVMSLVSRLRTQDDAGRERIAWALANIAARDQGGQIQTLAEGRDPVAAGVARHALELANLARNDDAAVRGPSAPRDQTVNRAFSRKFFEAMNRPDSPADDDDALLLDEADLIEADAEILDESDLIPTQ